MGTTTKTFYCHDCGTLMHEALGLHTLSLATVRGETCAHPVRLLACPKKRWFHVTKHPARLVSCDYRIEYMQG